MIGGRQVVSPTASFLWWTNTSVFAQGDTMVEKLVQRHTETHVRLIRAHGTSCAGQTTERDGGLLALSAREVPRIHRNSSCALGACQQYATASSLDSAWHTEEHALRKASAFRFTSGTLQAARAVRAAFNRAKPVVAWPTLPHRCRRTTRSQLAILGTMGGPKGARCVGHVGFLEARPRHSQCHQPCQR